MSYLCRVDRLRRPDFHPPSNGAVYLYTRPRFSPQGLLPRPLLLTEPAEARGWKDLPSVAGSQRQNQDRLPGLDPAPHSARSQGSLGPEKGTSEPRQTEGGLTGAHAS